MSLTNPWFALALVGVLLLFHIELFATLLNLARFSRPLPDRLKAIYDKDKLANTAEYAGASARVDVIRDAFFLATLLAVWWLGGFGWLHEKMAAFGWGEVWTGVTTLAVLTLAQTVLSLPFQWWDTFGVEAQFGFNRTTPATFIGDQIKGLVLMALLGLPVTALVIWFFDTQPWAAVYAWVSVALFSIAMTWAAPRFIMPLFLKFKPLEEGPLRQAILAMAERLKFPVKDVSVVDGSRRSSKANAFFAGFGKNKRIALYDTLIEGHTQEELLAVLAHEIGHQKRGHVPVHLIVGLLEMGLLFGLLHLGLKSQGMFDAFGVAGRPIGMGMMLFSILYRPLSTLLSVLTSAISRRHEFQADAYAREAVNGPQPLMDALMKLSADHLSHPMPHPFYVGLHYSHPPLEQRLAALEAARP